MHVVCRGRKCNAFLPRISPLRLFTPDFTACALLFVLLFVLMLARTGWRLTPQALLSTVVGWLLLCAVIIGVVYLVVSRRKTKGNGTDGGTERNV